MICIIPAVSTFDIPVFQGGVRCGVNKTKFKTEYRYILLWRERSNRAHVFSPLTKFTSIYGVENGSTSASNITEITGQIAFTLHVR